LFGAGNLLELLNDNDLLIEKLTRFLSSLSDENVYTVLFVLRWSVFDSGLTRGITIGQSLELTNKNSPRIIAAKIRHLLEETFKLYELDSADCELLFMYRQWLDLSDFTTDLATIAQTIDKVIVKQIYKKESQDLTIQKRIESGEIGSYNSILMDNYGEPIVENGHVVGYKTFKDEGFVVKDVEDENGVKSKLVTVKEIIEGKLVLDDSNDFIKWVDTKTPTGFTREMDKITKYFNQEGRVEYTEGEYYFPD
jgi:hypothetical protein